MSMTVDAGFHAVLAAIVGASQVLTRASGADMTAWERDWRGRQHGRALAVVRPGSTAEVAAVVRACAVAGVAVVPQGGNTGLVVGGVPDDSGQEVVLSLQRLNRIRHIDPANLTLTAEAGCILQRVQEAAEAVNLLFPLSLAAEGSCTIGGNLATNAGGTQVLRYGNARDLCLGLEVVTAQGDIWQGLSGLRKDNTGYDLRHLFIGSEGTLGIVTAASLRLYPQPAAQLTAWATVPSLDAAVALFALAQARLAAGLTGFELMGQFALSLVDRHIPHLRVPLWADAPYAVLLEFSSSEGQDHAHTQLEELLAAALNDKVVGDVIVADNLAQARALWHIRESIPLAQTQEGLNIKHDVSVAVSRIPTFVADATAALQTALPGSRVVNFGHVGDGNLHFNVQAPIGIDPAVFLREQEAQVNGIVYDAVARAGGSISAEHGIGTLKADTLPDYKSPVALALMQRIKHALDPAHTLNPGRVLRRRVSQP